MNTFMACAKLTEQIKSWQQLLYVPLCAQWAVCGLIHLEPWHYRPPCVCPIRRHHWARNVPDSESYDVQTKLTSCRGGGYNLCWLPTGVVVKVVKIAPFHLRDCLHGKVQKYRHHFWMAPMSQTCSLWDHKVLLLPHSHINQGVSHLVIIKVALICLKHDFLKTFQSRALSRIILRYIRQQIHYSNRSATSAQYDSIGKQKGKNGAGSILNMNGAVEKLQLHFNDRHRILMISSPGMQVGTLAQKFPFQNDLWQFYI